MHLTPHQSHYYSLGEPGPGIRHIWICLHGHSQSVSDLAAQLVNLDTPERLLILPQGLERLGAAAVWFRAGSLAQDLAIARAFLDELSAYIRAACPANTPLTVLGYGEGAVAAGTWLATNTVAYERLLFYAAVFPAAIKRNLLFEALPARPIIVIATTTDIYTPEAEGHSLVLDLQAAGQAAQLRYVDEGPLTLAALGAGSELSGLKEH